MISNSNSQQCIEFKKKPDSVSQIKKVLSPLVNKWFFSKFKELSLPQLYGVFEIHSRNNILVSAPTGSGKTLTCFLSILNELVDSAQKGILKDRVYCVYVSPLKALSRDIRVNLIEPLQEIEELNNEKLGIRVRARTGDTSTKERTDMLKNPPHILITTPESLSILLTSPKFQNHLKNVEWFIVDEVHALAENKRGVHLSLTMEMLQRVSPGMCRIGLSATVAPLEDVAQFLVGTNRSCKVVDVQFIKELDLKVISPVSDVVNEDFNKLQTKTYALIDDLIQKHKTTLIFTNTRAGTERLVHHLKERFPKNYTEVIEGSDSDKPPENPIGLNPVELNQSEIKQNELKESELKENELKQKESSDIDGEELIDKDSIGAHHGSLSKDMRHTIESKLRRGELKCVVCSTSLELGIDIGYIDLVILMGSPKSVARALQRVGRSGHQLHAITKGRIIVTDRDDLVECSVLLKNAVEKKIDRIHIPKNALDVLSQQIYGICINEKIHKEDLLNLIKSSFCFRDLSYEDFNAVIDYLAGEYTKLEDRHIYAKIWFDRETGMLGKRGRLARVTYMTNIGTIPDQSGTSVKIGEYTIGSIDEAFLERLKSRDVFVLGGSCYRFKFSRGMVAQVEQAPGSKPTVPSWYSDMLPLSFDLASDIGRFRKLVDQRFKKKESKKKILKFINDYLYIDDNGANSIYEYFKQQFDYSFIPSDKKIVIEEYESEDKKYAIFHSLFGRRVNDCLSRAVAFAMAKTHHIDVEIGVNDNAFYVASKKRLQPQRALNMLESKRFHELLDLAIDKTQVLSRRFRHCAGRALMILRTYKGIRKRVGRQQVSSMILMSAVKRISKDFPILKEARREVLEDVMDLTNSISIIDQIESNKIKIEKIETKIPSPFAFNIMMQGYADIMKMEDRAEFLKRMHNLVMASISLKKGKKNEPFEHIVQKIPEPIDYDDFWNKESSESEESDEVIDGVH